MGYFTGNKNEIKGISEIKYEDRNSGRLLLKLSNCFFNLN